MSAGLHAGFQRQTMPPPAMGTIASDYGQAGGDRKIHLHEIEIDDPSILHNAIPGLELEHVRLESGSPRLILTALQRPEFSLHRVRYAAPVSLSGHWSPGTVAIAVNLNIENALDSIQSEHSDALVPVNPKGTSSTYLPRIQEWTAISFNADCFAGKLAQLDRQRAMASAPLDLPRVLSHRQRHVLTGLFDRAFARSSEPQPSGDSSNSADLAEQLLDACAEMMVTAQTLAAYCPTLNRRQRIARRAEAYLRAHVDQSVRMRELCKAVGASQRSLEYAFQDVYRMGAMAYMRTMRLNEVRRALVHAAATDETVTSVAMDWGFWHLGEFAGSYKRLFGESPAQTLRRGH
jgi:AraC family transcriptional regulator, ethanolamine operon transcriptional activator